MVPLLYQMYPFQQQLPPIAGLPQIGGQQSFMPAPQMDLVNTEEIHRIMSKMTQLQAASNLLMNNPAQFRLPTAILPSTMHYPKVCNVQFPQKPMNNLVVSTQPTLITSRSLPTNVSIAPPTIPKTVTTTVSPTTIPVMKTRNSNRLKSMRVPSCASSVEDDDDEDYMKPMQRTKKRKRRSSASKENSKRTTIPKKKYTYHCKVKGCTNLQKGGGKCISHGGGKRCVILDCDKIARFAGSKCHIHRYDEGPLKEVVKGKRTTH